MMQFQFLLKMFGPSFNLNVVFQSIYHLWIEI